MNSLYGTIARTRTFSDIFEDVDVFKTRFAVTPYNSLFTATDLELIYFILISNFSNSHIASSDENRFEFQLFTIIFQYGLTWLKKLEIQKKLRELTENDIIQGSKTINNSAFNPADAPGTSGLEELTYINNQTTTNFKKSKLEAYSQLWSLLETDVTSAFIYQFRKLFLSVIEPEEPLFYITETEDE